MISVITTNLSPEDEPIILLIKNLAAQEYKDFELILVDGHYNKNKFLVRDICRDFKIYCVHVPMCAGIHMGRKWHWELYNNAILLASRPYFLRVGVHRYISKKILKCFAEKISQNTVIDLTQKHVDSSHYKMSMDQLEEACGFQGSGHLMTMPKCHCGMFGFSRELMIEMNGNDETLSVHHWEDCEINSRWENKRFSNVKMFGYHNALLRIDHDKTFSKYKIESKPTCDLESCISRFDKFYTPDFSEVPDYIRKIHYRDFPWIVCKTCKAVSPLNVERYYNHIKRSDCYLSPIGVDGFIGRDIRRLNEDINKLVSLDSKVDLLQSSHTNNRYLR